MSEEGNMAKHRVEIRFDAAGPQIICVPHKLIVKKRDVVEWRCVTEQPFTVDFGWDSPFPEISFSVPAGKTKEASIPADAPEGRYEYFVALYDPKTRLVYTFDPDMIIRR
jgi:hypothetical protein